MDLVTPLTKCFNGFKDKAWNSYYCIKWFQTSLQSGTFPRSHNTAMLEVPSFLALNTLFHISMCLHVLFHLPGSPFPLHYIITHHLVLYVLWESGKTSPSPLGEFVTPFFLLLEHFCTRIYVVMVASLAFIPLFFCQQPSNCPLGIRPSSIVRILGLDWLHTQSKWWALTDLSLSEHFIFLAPVTDSRLI